MYTPGRRSHSHSISNAASNRALATYITVCSCCDHNNAITHTCQQQQTTSNSHERPPQAHVRAVIAATNHITRGLAQRAKRPRPRAQTSRQCSFSLVSLQSPPPNSISQHRSWSSKDLHGRPEDLLTLDTLDAQGEKRLFDPYELLHHPLIALAVDGFVIGLFEQSRRVVN